MPSSSKMRQSNGYKYVSDKLLTAIVQDITADGERAGRKYRNIPDNDNKRGIFEKYAKRAFPNAFMVIYYNHSGGEVARVKLK